METTGIFRFTTKFWNGATAIGDVAPGQSVLGYTGQPPQYSGQLGAVVVLNYTDAVRMSDPAAAATQTLNGGRYQYVQFAADGTAYAAGQGLYWKNEQTYTVTNVPPTNKAVAGVCLSAVTQGNYWLVQTDGVANCLFAAALTTPALDESIHLNAATPPLFVNAATAATAIVAGGNAVGLVQFVGVPKIAPVSSTITQVYLRGIVQVN